MQPVSRATDRPSPAPEGGAPAVPDRLTPLRFAIAAARCVRFYSRLPMPALPGEGDAHAVPDFRIEPVGLPIAALLIALPAVAIGLAAAWLRLDPLLAGALCVAALVVTTGAFHEDGLGDSADGLFGGHTVERRLEIMKDSRIGVFAGCAIMLSLLLRATALAAILGSAGAAGLAGALLIAAMVSRVEGVRVLATLPSARAYGAAAAVGRPTVGTALLAAALAAALAAGIGWLAVLPLLGVIGGVLLGAALVSLLARLARRLIGGQTGDIAGAAQQLSEIGVYVGLAAALAR